MKKIFSLLLALIMVLSLSVTAFAANTNAHVITITNASAAIHSYSAYQVFAGDYDSTTGKLSNIVWGSGVNGADLLDALKADADFVTEGTNAFAACTTAEDVADVLKDFTTEQAQNFADVVGANLATVAGTSTATAATAPDTGYTYSIPVTGDGYYFIKDAADPTYPEGSQTVDTLTDYILQVVGDVEVVAKSGTVTVKKTVATGGYACGNTDANHTHTIADCGLAYADDNTAEIGDIVSFKLESTVPAEAAAYDYYYFIFGDTLSNGLTFDSTKANMKVTFINGTTETTATAGTDYTVVTNYKNYTFAVALTNAKAHAGQTVVVTYEATVNENAVIGKGGNVNEVKVEYSKNPNTEYGGGNNGFPADDSVTPDGETPADKSKTYVTEINLLKVDGEDNTKKLEGAVFTIKGITESVVVRTKDVFTAADNGAYYLLKDGSYTTTAPQVEAMVEQTDRTAGGYVVCQASDASVKYTIGGTSYRVATTTEMNDTSVSLYKHMASNEYLYESTTQKYTKDTQTVYECSPETFSLTGTTAADGTLVVTGLNAGTYTITELIAPDGYNLLKNPIVVNVDCTLPAAIVTGAEECTWSYTGSDNNNIGTVQADGTVVITIENNSGSTLPETGGIGVTIFYVLGGILLVGAAILLITKKRMGAEN